MTTPKSRLAYKMHFDVFDKAMADPNGIRIKLADRGKAWRLRLEMHHARGIDREDNRNTYDEGHMLHGCSVYDELLITIEDDDGQTWLYIHKRRVSNFHIENLSEVPETESIAELEESSSFTAPFDNKAPVQELEKATELERRF